jgi:GNAT superfamily N-acetyltransferase
MDNLTISEMLPSAEDYNCLRIAVGWRPYREEVIKNSLPHSIYCICALVGDQTVGMARIIGDAGMVYYIQDVIVLPEYQRQGIGTQMMDLIMIYLRAHSHHNTILGLMAAVGKEPFYEKYGFTRRPTEKLGAGMTLFWQAE